MKTDYRVFQFSLLAMAPIHIGSGEKYTSREFIYENRRYYFPDMGKFYNRMIEKGLDRKFEQFIQETKPSARNNRLISLVAIPLLKLVWKQKRTTRTPDPVL